MCPAPIGNQFWKARAKHGRDKIFSTPKMLLDAAHEYFEWVDANPLIESKAAQFQGEQVDLTVKKMRAMTLEGLYIFLGVSKQTWFDYKAREDFVDVMAEIEAIIRTQKFAGAAADMLNANIIARDLGLKDASTNEITGKDGGPIVMAALSNEELAAEIAKYGLEQPNS